MEKTRISTIIRWTARIWSILVIAFLILTFGVELVEHLTGTPRFFIDSVPARGFEIIGILLTQILLFIGFVIAFKWDVLGGLIIVGTMIGHWIIEGIEWNAPALVVLEVLMIVPGLIFLVYWYLTRSQQDI